jgi:periplasmic protein CpxP/Spy
MHRSIVTLLAGLAVFGLSACHHHRPDPAKVQKLITNHVNDELDELKATDLQRQKVLASTNKLITSGRKLHEDAKSTHEAMLAEWEKETPDRAAVRALIDERLEAFKAFAYEAADEVIVTHGILTPAQRADIATKIRERLAEEE